MTRQTKRSEPGNEAGGASRRAFWLTFVGSAVFSGLLTLNAIELLLDASVQPAQAANQHAQVNATLPRPGHVLAGHVAQELR